MPADRKSRTIMADSIDQFLCGKITNREFDDAIHSMTTDDVICIQIRRQLWLFYCDIRIYSNVGDDALPAESSEVLRRWEALLRSAALWSEIADASENRRGTGLCSHFVEPRLTPKPKLKRNPYWPFSDSHAWRVFTEKYNA
jgi:hypothetical protein